MLTIIAFLALRIAIAWLFLSPIPVFISKWAMTCRMVELLFKKGTSFFAMAMIAGMTAGSFSILFGIYAQLGAALLFVVCTLGIFVHNAFAKRIGKLKLSDSAKKSDGRVFDEAKALGIVGHKTSAQKNAVLAAIMIFIMIIGSGPYSITGNLF